MPSTNFAYAVGLIGALASGAVCRGQFAEPQVAVRATFAAGGAFGWAVSELRDISGDGVMELMVGAPSGNAVHVYPGADGGPLLKLIGPVAGSRFGHALADAGDVNDDGVADIVAGAPQLSPAGGAYVLSGADGAVLWTLVGEVSADAFGYAVAGVGDVDGDGHSDVVIGARSHDSGGNGAGRVYVYSGRDGALLRTHDGLAATDALGSGVTGMQADLDGDGVGDYAAAAPGAGPQNLGEAYVWSGATGALLCATRTRAAATGSSSSGRPGT